MRRALIAVLALMLAASMQGASRAQDVRLHRAGEMRGIDGRVLGALRSLPDPLEQFGHVTSVQAGAGSCGLFSLPAALPAWRIASSCGQARMSPTP